MRRDIQGMRAVAVLLVVLSHAGIAAVAGGYIGVDVFFVISGFLITGILARSVTTTGRVSVLDFYARRARRILPAAAVVLVAILFSSALVYTSARMREVLTDTIWSAFFGANIHFGSAATGYFANDSFLTPLRHFWSLAVEEQFYLVWPLLLGCCALAVSRLVRGRRSNVALARQIALRWGLLLISLICVVSFAWSVYQTRTAPIAAYYSPFTRAYELGIGALLALGAGAASRLPAPVKGVASWVGLAAITAAALTYSNSTPFPGSAALLPVLGSALVLAGGLDGPRWGAVTLLGQRPMTWVGDISYSLYLWHWPILILPAAYVGHPLALQWRLLLIAASVVVAALSYYGVEEPFRRSPQLSRHRYAPLVLWPVGLAMVLVSAFGLQSHLDAVDARSKAPAAAKAPPGTPASLMRDVARSGALARAHASLPAALDPRLEDLFNDVTRVKDPACGAATAQVATKVCVIGDLHGAHTVVALGDSHMGMWLRPITELATAAHARVIPLLKQRCIPFDVLEQDSDGTSYPECREYGAWVEQQLRRIKPDLVIVSSLYVPRVLDPNTGSPVSDAANDQLFQDGATRTLTRLKALAPRVLVLGQTPILTQLPGDCLGSRSAHMGTCVIPVRSFVTARNTGLQTAARTAGAEFLDVLPWFCDTHGTCPIVVGNRIVYRDGDHITETYAEALKPVLAQFLHLVR